MLSGDQPVVLWRGAVNRVRANVDCVYIVVVFTLVEFLQSTDEGDGRPAYERYADLVAAAIADGRLAPGAKLPTVRRLSSDLGVSATTVMSMYGRLADQGFTTGEPGRGTFVRTPEAGAAEPSAPPDRPSRRRPPSRAWRRQSLAEAETRLKRRFPDAVDLMRGSPARGSLPLEPLRAAWAAVAAEVGPADLEYPLMLGVDPRLRDALRPRLARDGVRYDDEALLAMNSTQQFLALLTNVLVRDVSSRPPVVAVEEPGYQTAMDTFERAGCVLVGMAVDEEGVVPEALRQVLAAGTDMVVFTPRALSPTGASWSPARRAALADVLAEGRETWIVEDDYFAELAESRPGSLVSDRRLRDRTTYVRGFSKSVAPDLRVAVGVVGASIRPSLTEERSFCDGWTSSFAQRTLARLLSDPGLDAALERAAAGYRANRRACLEELSQFPLAAEIARRSRPDGGEGLHVWLRMPDGVRSQDVMMRAAAGGYLVADGEPFFLSPGDREHIRLNVGSADTGTARDVARVLAEAAEHSIGRNELFFTP